MCPDEMVAISILDISDQFTLSQFTIKRVNINQTIQNDWCIESTSLACNEYLPVLITTDFIVYIHLIQIESTRLQFQQHFLLRTINLFYLICWSVLISVPNTFSINDKNGFSQKTANVLLVLLVCLFCYNPPLYRQFSRLCCFRWSH